MILLTIAALAAALVDGSVRAEARGGNPVAGQDPSSLGLSADLLGRTSSPDGTLRFGLSPTAVLAQGSRLFARGFGEADLRLGGRGWARLRQALGYGTVDLSPLSTLAPSGPVPATVQPPPGSRFVTVEESTTTLELEYAVSRRLRLASSAAWVVSGGVDAIARDALPLSRGPLLRANVDWAATRLDTLGMELSGLDYRYSNGRRATVGSLTAAWRSQPWRDAELSLGVGPGIGRSQAPDQGAATVPYAVGRADLRLTPVRELSATFGAALEPLGDPLSGDVVERASLRTGAVWGRAGQVTLAARLIGSVAVTSGAAGPSSPQAGDRYLNGEVSMTWPLDARSSLAAGARGAFLSRPLLDQPGSQWIAFVSYGAQVPLLR
jgi:hypothetical protein